MSPQYKIDKRSKTIGRVAVAVEKARRNGGIVAATEEAFRIVGSSNTTVTVDEVADDIARLAVHKGVAVIFGHTF